MISREDFDIELAEMEIGEIWMLTKNNGERIAIVKINELEFEVYSRVGCESITNPEYDFLM